MKYKEHCRSCIITEHELERIPAEHILRHNGFNLDLPIQKIIDNTHGHAIRYVQKLLYDIDIPMLDGQMPQEQEMIETTVLGDDHRTFQPLFEQHDHTFLSDPYEIAQDMIEKMNKQKIPLNWFDTKLEKAAKHEKEAEYITDKDLEIEI